MSLEAMVWALRDAPVPDATARVVLMGLANHAGPDGRTAFPSVATLARYVQCSERTVHRKLLDLLEADVIRRGDQRFVEHLRSDRRPVVYDLNLASARGDTVTPGGSHGVTGASGREGHGVTPEAERGDTGGIHGVTTVSDRTVLEPSIETPALGRVADAPRRDSRSGYWR